MEAVACELNRRDIVPDVAGPYGLREQVSNQVGELLLRSLDVLPTMEECRCTSREV